MKKFRELTESFKNRELNECWDTHVQKGYKMKGGKRVPNCVPRNESVELDEAFRVGQKVKIKTSDLSKKTMQSYKNIIGKTGKIVKDYGDGDVKVNFGGNNDWSVASKDLMKESVEMDETMMSTGGGIAGMHQSVTPTDGLPQIAGREADRIRVDKKKKKTNETFAGCRVFELTSEEYNKCMRGRMKYERWDRKMNMEDFNNQDIRSYSHRNPGQPIVIKDSTTGIMAYLIPPSKR